MTTEAASLALAQARHDHDLDAEETALVEESWECEWEHMRWHPTYDHRTFDPFIED